ncbi:helix-turn-helix domain-containing protein [Rhizobium calliandrae]|uniref:Helix-turn-helix domain-containing protein n=1 Tax=Rhizobium calliandrae TaxID=1312182 RepID=A0ABT7KHZ7_9HYPH|nr:AraC family transcriptional regulator [Rhizobium calliandrae]MDL2408256.1 helix-turn-helix domain-containing protein [Rhizobium calliandrae]
MSQSSNPHLTFKRGGSTFDGMIETLGAAFGEYRAELVSPVDDFQWSLDFSNFDCATVIKGFHRHEFQFQIQPTTSAVPHLSVVLPRSGGMGVTYGSREAVARHGKLLLYNNLEAESVMMYGRSNVIDELLLDWNVVLQTLDQTFETPFSGSLNLLPELEMSTPAGQMIGSLAETVIQGLRDPSVRSPVAMAHVTQALADVIVRLVPHKLSHLLDRQPCMIAPKHVRRAIEFMEANISQPIRMPMVAEAAGVSIRALQLGFRAFRETTPAAYLARLRLRAARVDLLDPANASSTREICLKWGFFHFGRFSAMYKASYGEGPSDTRRRIRGMPPRACRQQKTAVGGWISLT